MVPSTKKIKIREKEKHTVANGTSEISTSQRELIPGLGDDIVLAEIIPRLARMLPWDKRPILSLLSRSWANAMKRPYPLSYDCLYNPDAIFSSGGFIVCRILYRDADRPYNEHTSLWVWIRFLGITSTLPPPPIRFPISKYEIKFVCDGDRVYALSAAIPGFVTEEQNFQRDVYHVWMLNLRDFNIRWKELPSLPRLGKHVHASTCAGQSYIWQRRRILSLEADGWKLSGSGENDCKWHWEHINLNTPPPQNLNFDKSNRLPSYIEVNEVNDVVMNLLYARRSLPPNCYERGKLCERLPRYIFLMPDVDGSSGSESRPIIYGDLYSFGVDPETNGVYMLKADLNNEKTRTVEGGGWFDFARVWDLNHRILREEGEEEEDELEDEEDDDEDELEDEEDDDEDEFEDEEEEEEEVDDHIDFPSYKQGNASAIRVFGPSSPWKRQHRLKLDNWRNETLNETLDEITKMKVALFGPVYVYQFLDPSMVK